MAEGMGIIWMIAIISFTVLEVITVQFVSLWFAGGALCGLIMFIMGASVSAQTVGFAICSAILLILTRPFVKKMTKNITTATNYDALLGKTAVITKATDSFGIGGETKIDGKYWTVKSADGEALSEGDITVVEKIEGVKLVVRK